MKILIIEDELAVRQTLQDLLELNGHTVLAAANGIEGVELAQCFPDLIFCDIGLPGMDGFQVIAAIQKLPPPSGGDIPFIFLTARADRTDLREGMSLGADDYITKPFTEEDIVKAIAARTRRLRPLRQRIEQLVAEHRVEIDANWSHELMTPLNGILGSLELIEAEVDHIQPGELRELLALIRVSAERQKSISRKIVDYYELERLRAAAPLPHPVSCAALESMLAGALRAAQEEQRMQDLSVCGDPGTVPLAEGILSAAVAAVVSNAFRYSAVGQPVTVTGRRRAAHYLIDIVDQGRGMTAEQCAKIEALSGFERGKHTQQGLGLGLAIARSAAEIAGGKLSLMSEPGQPGLHVSFKLPCCRLQGDSSDATPRVDGKPPRAQM